MGFVQFALPKEYGSSEILREDESFNPCKKFGVIEEFASTCSTSSFNSSSVIDCNDWVYDTNEFVETLTTKSNLVCEDEWKRRILGTLMMLGLLIGSIIGGRLGDKFGRKVSILGAHLVMIPVVMFAGYAPNYETYATLRFVSATCLPIMWISGHVLTLELFGKEFRKSIAMVKDFFAPMSELVLVIIIYTTRHWTYIHLWAGVACLLPLPLYFIVTESPRWLATNGKIKEAEEILTNIGIRNGKEITVNQKIVIRKTLMNIQRETNSGEGKEDLNPLDMMRPTHYRKTLILLLNWVTIVVGVYTLSLNATKLSGDLFLNYSIVVLAGSFPGTFALLFTLKYFGRRLNLFYTQFILGICCVVLAFIPKIYRAAIIVFYLVGKCFSDASFLVVWLVTAELYPTNLRNQAVGTCSTISRVFGLVAPFVARLAVYWSPLPMLILGVPSLFSACLVYFLPETKYIELPATMKDADELELKRKGGANA